MNLAATDLHPLTEGCAPQCGALCWRLHRGKVEVLLITSRDTGRWVLPKGWEIAGLGCAESARREAWEEAGVEGDLGTDALGQFAYDKVLRPGKFKPCSVTVWPLHVTRLANRFPERKERQRKWFSAPKAARLVAEPGLRAILVGLQDQLAPLSPRA